MKKFFLFLLVLLVFLIVILVFNTLKDQPEIIVVDPVVSVDVESAAIDRMAEAIKIKTISYDDASLVDTTAFKNLHAHLERSFPLVHSALEKEIVKDYSLLFKWKGTDASLPPVILMGHMDVVPVEEETLAQWDADPFAGIVKDGYIWGRGALDDKNGVMAILEAVEILLKEGFRPRSTVYLAFGHDEETGGKGAIATAAVLKKRNVKARFILDEGGIVANGIVPGIDDLVALIGTAEKGYTSLELAVNMEGGHSSMPAKETAIEVLSRAVVKLRDNPFPARISPPVEDLLSNIKHHMPFFQRLVLSNLWLFKSSVIGNYEKTSSGNASVRTTTAPTIFKSGVKENLLPAEATAIVNFRILPGETSDDVVDYVKEVIDDERVMIDKYSFVQEPSFVSPSDIAEFNMLRISLKQVFGDIIVSPYLVVGATDARHYREISDNIYRFSPMILESEDLNKIHGIDERINVENYKNSIRFYYRLIRNLDLEQN